MALLARCCLQATDHDLSNLCPCAIETEDSGSLRDQVVSLRRHSGFCELHDRQINLLRRDLADVAPRALVEWIGRPHGVQRQVFEAFGLQIAYDKVERRIEISATVSETVADAF